MSTISPNMNLPVSTIGVDSGLIWEQNLNTAQTTIDQHNHTSGNGVQIPPSGLNINAPLPFNNQSATEMQAAVFTPQASYATLYGIYSIGNDLYFNDGAGNVIQMTAGGAVNATSSGISSGTNTASFVSNVLVVNANTNKPANIQAASILLGNNSTGSKYLTLSPPAGMGSNIIETLPTIPAATSWMQMDSSGNMSASTAVSAGLTTSNLSASAGILGTQLASGTIAAAQITSGTITTTQISSSAGILGTQLDAAAAIAPAQMIATNASTSAGSTSTTTSANVTNLTSIAFGRASTRPVYITFTGGSIGAVNSSGSPITVTWSIIRNVSTIASYAVVVPGSTTLIMPCGAINSIIPAASASGNYTLNIASTNASCTISVTGVVMNFNQV